MHLLLANSTKISSCIDLHVVIENRITMFGMQPSRKSQSSVVSKIKAWQTGSLPLAFYLLSRCIGPIVNLLTGQSPQCSKEVLHLIIQLVSFPMRKNVQRNQNSRRENNHIIRTKHLTFSTTDISLKVKYSPVIKEEKRLPYSLFKKNRYQTGVGSNVRYSNSRYSTRVSIWPCT